MIRTSINLPEPLHQQLQFVAKGQNQTVSHLVCSILERGLAQQKAACMKQVYESLANVKGIGKESAPQVSATMNELLYGPDGAWKGRDE